ncbi:uncharacterized protein ACA1_389020 [Acanthamoeba castellanii str. Neff]|uniref:Inner membrane component domain-containing protein n=1 Tax=Acanthamoeba castellanii (strain ATCC 30010 / Neff) TaxID=1257118 RepID=L8GG86_ACACF|nr:uncharacterized protein ACA1_389020 [Acanthamoeba castellanii str. Neff]ELR11191.1 hypothetical protein ACA1_389020 [Acanthamoeba castellanii str. Neff]
MATVIQTTTTTTEVPGSKRHFWDREPLLSLRRVLWIVLGGWMFFLVFFFVGVAFAISIVGMPMAYEFFKFARFLLLPVGYRAISRSGKSKNPLRRPRDTACVVANVLWLIFFGWWLALMLVVLMVIQAVTIIGLPLVVEFPKLMKFIMWPFGKKIISKKSYRAGVAAGAAQTATVVPGTTVVTSV